MKTRVAIKLNRIKIILLISITALSFHFFSTPGKAYEDNAYKGRYIAGIQYDQKDQKRSLFQSASPYDSICFEFPAPATWPTGLTRQDEYFWIADQDSTRIYKLNSDGQVLNSYEAPCSFPAGLEWDGTNLWLVCEESAVLYKMDTTCAVINSFNLPDTSWDPNSWGLAWDGEYMWHSQYGDSARIYKLDLSDSLEIEDSYTPISSFILGITWNGNYLCGADIHDSTFYWMNTDCDTIGSILWQIPYPLGLYHDGANFWNVSSDSAHGGHEAVYRSDLITSIDEVISKPDDITMISAYPNPFNPKTTINYSLSNQSYIQLDIYNLLGQHIETLFEGAKQSGEYSIIWNADRFTSGIYFIRLKTNDHIKCLKLMLVK